MTRPKGAPRYPMQLNNKPTKNFDSVESIVDFIMKCIQEGISFENEDQKLNFRLRFSEVVKDDAFKDIENIDEFIQLFLTPAEVQTGANASSPNSDIQKQINKVKQQSEKKGIPSLFYKTLIKKIRSNLESKKGGINKMVELHRWIKYFLLRLVSKHDPTSNDEYYNVIDFSNLMKTSDKKEIIRNLNEWINAHKNKVRKTEMDVFLRENLVKPLNEKNARLIDTLNMFDLQITMTLLLEAEMKNRFLELVKPSSEVKDRKRKVSSLEEQIVVMENKLSKKQKLQQDQSIVQMFTGFIEIFYPLVKALGYLNPGNYVVSVLQWIKTNPIKSITGATILVIVAYLLYTGHGMVVIRKVLRIWYTRVAPEKSLNEQRLMIRNCLNFFDQCNTKARNAGLVDDVIDNVCNEAINIFENNAEFLDFITRTGEMTGEMTNDKYSKFASFINILRKTGAGRLLWFASSARVNWHLALRLMQLMSYLGNAAADANEKIRLQNEFETKYAQNVRDLKNDMRTNVQNMEANDFNNLGKFTVNSQNRLKLIESQESLDTNALDALKNDIDTKLSNYDAATKYMEELNMDEYRNLLDLYNQELLYSQHMRLGIKNETDLFKILPAVNALNATLNNITQEVNDLKLIQQDIEKLNGTIKTIDEFKTKLNYILPIVKDCTDLMINKIELLKSKMKTLETVAGLIEQIEKQTNIAECLKDSKELEAIVQNYTPDNLEEISANSLIEHLDNLKSLIKNNSGNQKYTNKLIIDIENIQVQILSNSTAVKQHREDLKQKEYTSGMNNIENKMRKINSTVAEKIAVLTNLTSGVNALAEKVPNMQQYTNNGETSNFSNLRQFFENVVTAIQNEITAASNMGELDRVLSNITFSVTVISLMSYQLYQWTTNSEEQKKIGLKVDEQNKSIDDGIRDANKVIETMNDAIKKLKSTKEQVEQKILKQSEATYHEQVRNFNNKVKKESTPVTSPNPVAQNNDQQESLVKDTRESIFELTKIDDRFCQDLRTNMKRENIAIKEFTLDEFKLRVNAMANELMSKKIPVYTITEEAQFVTLVKQALEQISVSDNKIIREMNKILNAFPKDERDLLLQKIVACNYGSLVSHYNIPLRINPPPSSTEYNNQNIVPGVIGITTVIILCCYYVYKLRNKSNTVTKSKTDTDINTLIETKIQNILKACKPKNSGN